MLDGIDLFIATPREKLAWVADAEPGILSMSILMSIDRSDLAPDIAVSLVQAHERQTSWWVSQQAAWIVAAADAERQVDEFVVPDPRPGHDGERTIRVEDAIREELAAATRWSLATTHSRIESARLMHGPLLRTLQALELGEISFSHVAIIVEAAGRLPGRWGRTPLERQEFAAACDALQDRVLRPARLGTLAATRLATRRAVLAIDAAGERRRREAARCTRSVYVSDDVDGMSTLIARLTTERAHAVMAAINQAAINQAAINQAAHPSHPGSPDGTTIDERRADALCTLVLREGSDGLPAPASLTPTAPVRAPIRAHLDLVIDLPTLLGLDDNAATLHGAGPIPADIVHDLLADPEVALTIRRLVADPITGHLLDVGRKRYAVPPRLREFVTARDAFCRFPGCRRRATRCQIDHATAWDDGGDTSAGNLGTLCVRHHQLKTHTGWNITTSSPDGSCTWTSPQGRTYHHTPEPVMAGTASGVSPP